MKKILALIVLAAVVYSCSHKTTPPPANTFTPPVIAKDTIIMASDTTIIPGDAVAGEATYVAKCAKCHKLKDPTKYTPVRWTGLLNKMAPKAHLDSVQKSNVLAFVWANAKKS